MPDIPISRELSYGGSDLREEEVQAKGADSNMPAAMFIEGGPEHKGKLGAFDGKSKTELARDEFSKAEIEAFEKAFQMFDVDGNGTLDIEEIERVLNELGKPMSKDEILDLLYDVDLGSSIKIDEFIQMMAGEKKFKTRDLNEGEKKMIKRIFQLFDYDRKEYWTFEDFTQYFECVDQDGFLEMTEENFKKVNNLLGAKDDSQMALKQLEKFYSVEDRTMASDLEQDYRRCCE